MEKYLLSCDWGTSSFRLYLLNARDGNRLAQVSSDEGIARVFESWKQQKAGDRLDFYREALKKHLHVLSAVVSFSLEGIPLVISGMASSSIGIEELPYAELPFPLDGQKMIKKTLPASPDFRHRIILLSGLKSDDDVMRGEETQLIGLAGDFSKEGVFLFPGTHSKHIYVRDGAIAGFKTFMTGELFQLLCGQSILRETLEMPPAGSEMNPAGLEAFHAGVNHPVTSSLLRSLFLTRTNYLFKKFDKVRNFYFLSGLLIGSELRDLEREEAGPIMLCGGHALSSYYERALRTLNLPGKLLTVSPEVAEQAASSGHLSLFQGGL